MLTLRNRIQPHPGNSSASTSANAARSSSVDSAASTRKRSLIKMVSGPKMLIGSVTCARLILGKFMTPLSRTTSSGTETSACPNSGSKTCNSLPNKHRKTSQPYQRDYQYGHFLTLFQHQITTHHQQVEIIDKDVIKGRTDSSVFNFSMREFFYTVKADIEDKVSRENVKNVLYALAARYDRIGYCQGMSGVAAFLLCFSTERTAFVLFCDLLENVYPQNFFLKSQYGVSLSGLLAESYFLQEYFIHYLTVIKKPLITKVRQQFYSQDQIQHLRTIIQFVSSKALLSLFVGIVSFSNCLFIWQEIKQHRSFEVIEKAFIASIYLNRERFLENRSFKVIEEIFERMHLEQFREFYHDVEIDQDMRREILKKYHEGARKKWQTLGEQYMIRTIQKMTSFTDKELNQLKVLFPSKNGISITLQQFSSLVDLYYQILKQQNPKSPLLETRPYFVSKIFQSFNSQNKAGLDFRQFILCLEICTKGKVKDRIRAILGIVKDEKGMVTVEDFNKFLKGFSQISHEKGFKEKKMQFEKRVTKCFGKQEKVHFRQLETLLNDEFINELSKIVKSQSPNIVSKMIEAYRKEKLSE